MSDITRHWIERFETAEKEILEKADPSEFDLVMLDAYRSQIISLKMELEKEQRNGTPFETQAEEG